MSAQFGPILPIVPFRGGAPSSATGAAGDWARFISFLNDSIGKYAVELQGTIRADSKQIIPNGARILGTEYVSDGKGTKIVQDLANDSDPLTAAFAMTVGAITANTTLNADVERGSYSIVLLAANVNVGDIIRIANGAGHGNTAGLRVSTHVAVAVAGVNVNLDRPVPRKYFSGATVQVIASVPQNIAIDGRGMLMTALAGNPGVRFFENNGGRRIRVSGIQCNNSGGALPPDLLFSHDTGSYQCTFDEFEITGDATSLAGAAFESTDGCHAARIKTSLMGYGFVAYDAADSSVSDSEAYRCSTAGFAAVSDTGVINASTHGCDHVTFAKTTALACVNGHSVLLGSTNTQLVATSSEGGTNGISIGGNGGDGTVIDGTTIVGGSCRRNATVNLIVGTSTKRTKALALDFGNGAATGALIQGDFDGEQLSSDSGNATQLITATGGTIRISKLTAVHTAVVNVIVFNGTTRAELLDSDVTCGAGANAVNTLDNLYIAGTKLAGAANGVVYSGNTTRLGLNNNFDGCTTAVLASGGTLSQGTVQLNGAVAVNVAWPDLKSTDRVRLTLKTLAGVALSGDPIVIYTPTVGFSVTGTAGDTSTYEYSVVS